MIDKNQRTYVKQWFNTNQTFNKGDMIIYEMPSFCSGDYKAKIYLDNNGEPYINKDDDFYEGCREYELRKTYDDNDIIKWG